MGVVPRCYSRIGVPKQLRDRKQICAGLGEGAGVAVASLVEAEGGRYLRAFASLEERALLVIFPPGFARAADEYWRADRAASGQGLEQFKACDI
jgi:hypothetical protein